MKLPELLAPAGNIKKLQTALHFGADAVYFAGKDYGLRSYAGNFSVEELFEGVRLCHEQGKKAYVTVNIFAKNADFIQLKDYLETLKSADVDGLIVSDAGMISFIKAKCPDLKIHLSTQANTLNKYAVEFWKDVGVERVVLARELSLEEIREIYDHLEGRVELEAFVHGAMCISYSGRCLLSTYLSNRDSNRGECVQPCRWEYSIFEASRPAHPLTLTEDVRGSYIMNSKDMRTIGFLDKIIESGIASMKIEGRMKSEYYVGTVVGAYRRRLESIKRGLPFDEELYFELDKAGHREYTAGFFLGEEAEQCYHTSKPRNSYDFAAEVLGYSDSKGCIVVEQRNRFFENDVLETLSADEGMHNRKITVNNIYNERGERVSDCKLVQEKLYIESPLRLEKFDMLRRARRNVE